MPYALRSSPSGVEISIPMSGVRAQDVSVLLDGSNVSVSLRVEHDISHGAQGVVTQERHIGEATRRFTFAGKVDASRARARLENGVLHLQLALGADGEPRRLVLA